MQTGLMAHLMRAAATALVGAGASLLALTGARAQSAPLVIAKQGYFFVGGKLEPALEGTPPVGHMYVEYQIPAQLQHPYPVVMIHGGSQTGTNFTGTPDGRDGWAQYFLRRGYSVYVVDQVARGRAAQWSQAQGPVSAANLKRVLQRFVAPEREKLWPQAERHTQWPGGGQPGDATFEQFYMSQFPSLVDYPKQQEINSAAGVALLEKIGPAVLLTHSQSGAFSWPIADRRPDLVKAIVAVEPNGPPVHETQFKGAPEWFANSPRVKLSGLGDVPLTYDPPLHAGEQLAFVRQDEPERADLVRCWSQAEPARKLAKLANIPVLVVMSEASYHAAYDHCTVNYLRQAGVKTEFVRLAEAGIAGNGHMMMLEKNSDTIAALMADWLDRTLPGGAK